MNEKYQHLFSPYSIGKVQIKNRYVLTAMGLKQFDAKGMINGEGIEYFTRFARGGFGLIVTSSFNSDTEIDKNTRYDRLSMMTHEKNFIASMTECTDRVHGSGAKIFAQVTMGVGRNGGFKSASPNPAFFNPSQIVGELTPDEIKRKIELEIEGARRCKAAGFDGVEIHALHYGYLLDQFAISAYNHRTDEYGGCLENRLRIPKAVVEGIKQVCGADYPVVMRLGLKSYMTGIGLGHASLTGENEIGRTLEEGVEICKKLESYGYDALACDVGTYESWYHQTPPMYTPKCAYIGLAEQAKKAVNIPVIMSGRMNDPDICEQAIADGKIDAVGIARAALADPKYPNKVAAGKVETIRPCLSCCQCIGTDVRLGNRFGCAVNPSITRDLRYGIVPAKEPKNVVVIGGGVSGMEAALTATISGHKVTVLEATGELGGNLIPAGQHSFKQDVRLLNAWFQRELQERKVDIRLNTRATPALIKELGAQVVIEATGSTVIMPKIPGIDHPKAASCMDVLVGGKTVGDTVTIVGGGLTGCEMAIEYAMEGKKVTLVEAMPDILSSGLPVPLMQDQMVRDILKHYAVDIRTGYKISAVNDEGAVITNMKDSDDVVTIPTDTVVMAVGFRSRPSMWSALSGSGLEVFTVGDANRVGSVQTSIWDAYEIARDL